MTHTDQRPLVPKGSRTPNRRYVDGTGGITPYVVKPAGVALVERLSAEGVPIAQIAKALGMDRRTLDHIRKRQPEVQNALDTGRSFVVQELTGLLMQKARSGEIAAIIYGLKTFGGMIEGKPMEGSAVTNNTQVNIHMPATVTEEQWNEIVKRLPMNPNDGDDNA